MQLSYRGIHYPPAPPGGGNVERVARRGRGLGANELEGQLPQLPQLPQYTTKLKIPYLPGQSGLGPWFPTPWLQRVWLQRVWLQRVWLQRVWLQSPWSWMRGRVEVTRVERSLAYLHWQYQKQQARWTYYETLRIRGERRLQLAYLIGDRDRIQQVELELAEILIQSRQSLMPRPERSRPERPRPERPRPERPRPEAKP